MTTSSLVCCIHRLNSRLIASYETYIEYVENPNLKPIEIVTGLAKIEPSFAIWRFNTKSIEILESTGDLRLMPNNYPG